MFTKIPIIDLAPMFSKEKEGLQTVAAEIKKIYTEIGFAYIVNHQVPQQLVDQIFAAARDFHALPFDEKMKIKHGKSFRGYMPRQGSTLKSSGLEEAKKPNESEAFIMLNELDKDSPDYQKGINLAGPNLWPETLPYFKDTVQLYYNAMLKLAKKLVKVFSLAFGLSEDDLEPYFVEPNICLRLQYYPKQPDIIPEEQFGIAPHTDYGFFTILAQDKVPGLQIKNQAEQWIDAPPIRGSFVLNSSDMLKRMTNGRFLSTRHRVINTSGQERYAIPFFFEPDMHTHVAPLPIFCCDKFPAKYEAVEYCDYASGKVKDNYALKVTEEA